VYVCMYVCMHIMSVCKCVHMRLQFISISFVLSSLFNFILSCRLTSKALTFIANAYASFTLIYACDFMICMLWRIKIN